MSQEWIMRLVRFTVCAMGCCWLLTPIVKADVLLRPDQDPIVLQTANEPTRGMTKSQVLTKYGEPRSKQPAVGIPPISSWDYGTYTVYFEGDFVLHSVHHKGTVDTDADK